MTAQEVLDSRVSRSFANFPRRSLKCIEHSRRFREIEHRAVKNERIGVSCQLLQIRHGGLVHFSIKGDAAVFVIDTILDTSNGLRVPFAAVASRHKPLYEPIFDTRSHGGVSGITVQRQHRGRLCVCPHRRNSHKYLCLCNLQWDICTPGE